MDIEDAVLPDGVDPANVRLGEDPDQWDDGGFDEDNVAYDEERMRAFNPQNGRWYRREPNRGIFDYGQLDTVVAHTIDCAYADCDGFRTVETSLEAPTTACPECGEPRMGRGQFTRDAVETRRRHKSIAGRTKLLRDDFSKEMDRLAQAGVGPIPAMDYLMCSVGDIPYEEWAEARDVSARAVKKNLRQVARTLGERVTYTKRGFE